MSSIQVVGTTRVFFALWPGPHERTELAAWQASLQLQCGGRVMRPDTLHVTLVFLGAVETARLEALKLAAQAVTGSPFRLLWDTARYWGHNHLAYAAPTQPPPALLQLVAQLEQRLLEQHFRFDRREYTPHVTLLRNVQWTDAPLPTLLPTAWGVRDFVLLQSVPDKCGACYRVLARFPLG